MPQAGRKTYAESHPEVVAHFGRGMEQMLTSAGIENAQAAGPHDDW